tara:strand:+ start:1205 stop:1459 length:255 start_codon:yes stop_codon:yes gene_type:complete
MTTYLLLLKGILDIGYFRDTIIIEHIKERGDRMKIVLSVDNGRTLDFSDMGDKAYMVEAKDHRGDVLAKVRISKEDIKRLAKAS